MSRSRGSFQGLVLTLHFVEAGSFYITYQGNWTWSSFWKFLLSPLLSLEGLLQSFNPTNDACHHKWDFFLAFSFSIGSRANSDVMLSQEALFHTEPPSNAPILFLCQRVQAIICVSLKAKSHNLSIFN